MIDRCCALCKLEFFNRKNGSTIDYRSFNDQSGALVISIRYFIAGNLVHKKVRRDYSVTLNSDAIHNPKERRGWHDHREGVSPSGRSGKEKPKCKFLQHSGRSFFFTTSKEKHEARVERTAWKTCDGFTATGQYNLTVICLAEPCHRKKSAACNTHLVLAHTEWPTVGLFEAHVSHRRLTLRLSTAKK